MRTFIYITMYITDEDEDRKECESVVPVGLQNYKCMRESLGWIIKHAVDAGHRSSAPSV